MPSEQEIVWDRCRSDPWFFATEYVKTQDPQADKPVRAWPKFKFLEKVFNAFVKFSRVVVPKSRQMLLSWAICVYALWIVLFQDNRLVMIQSEKQDKARHLIARINFILRHLPAFVFPCRYDAKLDKIEFFHDQGTSTVWAVPSGPQQIASFSPTCVIFDESALQDELRAAHQAALPAVRSGGQMIDVSSVRSPDDTDGAAYFSWLWHEAKEWHVEHVHYSLHPEYDDAWVARVKAEYDDDTWNREMEMDETVGLGKSAFKPPFDKAIHVTPLQANPLLQITRGFDYGLLYPACVWLQIHPETLQVCVLHSETGDDLDLKDFLQKCVIPISKDLAGVNCTRLRFRDWDDPEGLSRNNLGAPTQREIMNQNGIFPINDSKKVPVDDSVKAIRETLAQVRGKDGILRPGIIFSPSCEKLIKAMNGAYGFKRDDAHKKRIGFYGGSNIHEVDGFRYAMYGEKPWRMRESYSAPPKVCDRATKPMPRSPLMVGVDT